MNKKLFWAGFVLQMIHMGAFLIAGTVILLAQVDWSLMLVIGILYVTFNVLTVIMILSGLFGRDKD